MKKNNNKKYFLLGILVVVVIGLIFGLLIYLNNKKNNYSFSEKSWINSNMNNVIDISVEGSLPIYSNNGQGAFYDFINALEKDTNLTFNVVVNGNANYAFSNKKELSSNDVVFYSDHYVLISSLDNAVSDFSQISNQPIGVLSTDKDYISDYLSNYGLKYETYETMTNLENDMSNGIVYAIIPMQKYMNTIINGNYKIVYHIEGLNSNYVLTINDDSLLKEIVIHFFAKYKENLLDDINANFLSLYYNSYSISDIDKQSITANDLLVGYIDNLPYEGRINNVFSGFTKEYLDLFGKMTGATYKFIKYRNIDELNNALNSKKVDIVMNYYNLNNSNYNVSKIKGNVDYVIISHINNDIVIEGIKSINNKEIKMINNTNLYSYFKSFNISITGFNNFSDLIHSLKEDDIVVVEKEVYNYFKNKELKNFVIKVMGQSNQQNSFLLSSDNRILSNLFSFYISTLGTKQIMSRALSSSSQDLNTNIVIEFIVNNITFILALIFAVSFLLFKINKKIKVTKKIKKEDKMLYLDVMTNLKNRNYLNDNLVYWEANKVYPQAIVIIDLNSIALINDTKGHEEGDKQIQSAANILINTQRENSEIVRTDGNEFLVYLVGYDEKQIVTYVNKLVKEFKELPYEYGASVGYHMITAESTTIDDAINEAIIMMRKNKGE